MGKLILVPTPIGNLKDITLRALEVLGEVDAILAEDTRVSGKLLKHYDIQTPLISHHQNNEHKSVQGLVRRLSSGSTFALITDAGTPAISDPGFLLVRACLLEGIKVESLPGATAFVPALVNSGIPCNQFVFEGFVPQKKGRATALARIANESRTVVLYESPHRIVKTLGQLAELCGEKRRASVSRELTKLHEENVQGSLPELKKYFEENTTKGEFVLVLEGKTSAE